MTGNRNLDRNLTVVEKLRPVTTVDQQWPAPARDAALEQLLTAVADASPQPPRRSRTRRILLTAALTAGLVSSGVGIAAAGGLLPESFTKRLSFWTTGTAGEVDVQTAQRVAQAPGPDGKVLSVWSAKSPDGTTCVAALFESPGDLDRPAPASFQLSGGQCAQPDRNTTPFGSMGGSADQQGTHTMWASAGTAVRAEVRLPDGNARAAVPAEGMFFFWYVTTGNGEPPTLTGYDAAGNVVAEWPLPNLMAPR